MTRKHISWLAASVVALAWLVPTANAQMQNVFDWSFTATEGWTDGNSETDWVGWEAVQNAGWSVVFNNLGDDTFDTRDYRLYVDTRDTYERLTLRILRGPSASPVYGGDRLGPNAIDFESTSNWFNYNARGATDFHIDSTDLALGRPVITYDFDKPGIPTALQGKFSFESGITGVDIQSGRIELRSGNDVLLRILLRTSANANYLEHGGESGIEQTVFSGPTNSVYLPGDTRFQKYELTWSVAEDGTESMASLWVQRGDGENPLLIQNVSFQTNGVPDNILLSAGTDAGTNRGIYFNEMSLQVIPEPSTMALLAGAALVLGIRRRFNRGS